LNTSFVFFYRLKYFKSFPHDEPDFEKIMVAIAGGSPPSAMVLINPHRNIKGHLAFEIYIKPEDQNSIFFIYFETFGSQFLPFSPFPVNKRHSILSMDSLFCERIFFTRALTITLTLTLTLLEVASAPDVHGTDPAGRRGGQWTRGPRPDFAAV